MCGTGRRLRENGERSCVFEREKVERERGVEVCVGEREGL